MQVLQAAAAAAAFNVAAKGKAGNNVQEEVKAGEIKA